VSLANEQIMQAVTALSTAAGPLEQAHERIVEIAKESSQQRTRNALALIADALIHVKADLDNLQRAHQENATYIESV